MTTYDIVIPFKNNGCNHDLRYTLRSIDKFIPHNKIWIIGEEPNFTTNINYMYSEQIKDSSSQNQFNALKLASHTNEISEDFLYMNDDFLALEPIDIEKDCNLCIGTIQDFIDIYKYHNSRNIYEDNARRFQKVLEKLGITNIEHQLNYENHIASTMKKSNLAKIFELEIFQNYKLDDSKEYLYTESIYKNLFRDEVINYNGYNSKIGSDNIQMIIDKKRKWLSVFDNMIGNEKDFPKLNKFLKELFPDKCRYEK